jgi:ABC-type sugar transport system substrate-binding protein
MSRITRKAHGGIGRRAAAVSIAALAVALACAAVLGNAQAAKPKQLKIAVLAGSTTNAYQAASIVAAKKAAARLNVSLTIYDGAFDGAKQISQMEDVIGLGTGRFDGIAFFPLDNVATIAVVKKALAAGFTVGIADAVLGPRLDTQKLQVAGLAVQASPVWNEQGQKLGSMVVEACKGKASCKVGWAGGLKVWPPEGMVYKNVQAVLAKNPSVKIVVNVGDTFYTREGGLKIIGTMIQSHPDLDVIVAADQALLGAETALKDAGMLGKVKLVGLGGSIQSKPRIADGRWFGTAAQGPADEGRLAIEGIVQKIRTGKGMGGINTTDGFPDQGRITKANVAKFNPQFSG